MVKFAANLSMMFNEVDFLDRFDAAQIDDHLATNAVPSVVLMNPPFSVMANVEGRMADASLRHVTSALARLVTGGRLVTIVPRTPNRAFLAPGLLYFEG